MSEIDFAQEYQNLTDEQLAEIRAADLTAGARIAYDAEVKRRAAPEYLAAARARLEERHRIHPSRYYLPSVCLKCEAEFEGLQSPTAGISLVGDMWRAVQKATP